MNEDRMTDEYLYSHERNCYKIATNKTFSHFKEEGYLWAVSSSFIQEGPPICKQANDDGTVAELGQNPKPMMPVLALTLVVTSF